MKSFYKIVHTAAGNQWHEPEKRIISESLWMQDQGHQVIIIAPADSPLLSRAKAVGLSAYPIAFKGFTRATQSQQLKKILEDEQPNILNAHGRTDGSISLKAAKKARVPCRILSCHSAKPLRSSLANRTLYKKLAHYIFTGSDHTTQRLKGIFKLKDMEIFSIPGGIDRPRSLSAPQEAQEEMADRLKLEKQTRFIGVLSPCETRFSAAHAVEVLKAFKSLPPGPHLLIPAPTREIRNHLDIAIGRLALSGRAHLIEPQNLWDYYRSLACGIHIPSRRFDEETIPRAALEAMYASCPIAALSTMGICEAVSNGKTGMLWQGSEPEEIARAIKTTLNNPDAASQRAEAAKALVEKRFTIDTMGRDIIRIYRLHQVRIDRRYYKVDPDIFPEEY